MRECLAEERPVRFGLIGAGMISQAYVQAFERCGEARIVAVADVRQEAARALAEGVGARAFSDHRALAEALPEDGGVEAVVVCTPPATHPDICLHLLERGIHVLCEKPLAIDSAGAAAILEAASGAGVKFTMASKFRYVEDVVRAKSIVTSGILGDLTLFENAFTARVDMSSRWNSNPQVSGGGVLIDNGTHSVDLMRYFLGPIAEVQAVEGRRSQGLAVEETVHLFARSAAGVLGSIDLSWSIQKEQDVFLAVYGSQGTVRVGWKESRYRQSTGRDWVVFGKGYDKVQAFRNQIVNFVRAIRGEEALLITAQDGLASVRVVEAAYRSLRGSRWSAVEPALDPGRLEEEVLEAA